MIIMKKLLLFALLGAGLDLGCVSRYNITLSSGTVVTAKGRPKLDKDGFYHYKDATGKEVVIPSIRVRKIEVR
jgi:hypothetical protein